MMTIQGKRVLVTAYPYAGSVRTQVSLLGGETACGDAGMLLEMAKELRAAALCIGRGGEALAAQGKEEEENGV